MVDRDRLFKELLSTFSLEFLDLFFPNVTIYLEPSLLTFLDEEVFTDITAREQYEANLVVKVQFCKQVFFLIHVENQAKVQSEFSKRMFRYFARLYEKFALSVYPNYLVLFYVALGLAPTG